MNGFTVVADGRVDMDGNVMILPKPKALARSIVLLNADEQAELISLLAQDVIRWPMSYGTQLEAVAQSSCLTSEGRALMRGIGEYAQEGGWGK